MQSLTQIISFLPDEPGEPSVISVTRPDPNPNPDLLLCPLAPPPPAGVVPGCLLVRSIYQQL